MMKGKRMVFNGLLLTGSRPPHSLVLEYLTRKGCVISYDNEYMILDGNYSFPNKKKIFTELVALSKELYCEVNFDLDIHNDEWGGRSFEVIDKKSTQNHKVSSIKLEGFEQLLIDLLFIEYLLHMNAVVYLDKNNEICYLAGDEPLENSQLISDATKFIKQATARIGVEKITTSILDEDKVTDIDAINSELANLLTCKYLLEKGCPVALAKGLIIFVPGDNVPVDAELLDRQIEEFQARAYLSLQSCGLRFGEKVPAVPAPAENEEHAAAPAESEEHAASPGLFTAFTNWIWGSDKQPEHVDANRPKPKATP